MTLQRDVSDEIGQIKFIDFAQRRKIGFRGAFEFDNKRLLLASETKIKILAYFQNMDHDKVLDNLTSRSKSPMPHKSSPLLPKDSNTKNTSAPSNGLLGALDKIASIELATLELDQPQEKIVFVKFLDDNDPRLLFLVTYHEPTFTTYMKVVKIEKAKRQKTEAHNENPFAYFMQKESRQRSFSFAENQPVMELKKEIINTQMNNTQSVDPNAIDNIAINTKLVFNPFENLKGTLKADTKGQADLQITSLGMKNTIRLKADWNPESNLEQILLQQIEQIEDLREDIEEEEKGERKNKGIQQYELVQSKLGKFKNTKLSIIFYGIAPANNMGPSRSKQLISVDQNQVYRVHKVKGARLMSEKDFLLTQEELG